MAPCAPVAAVQAAMGAPVCRQSFRGSRSVAHVNVQRATAYRADGQTRGGELPAAAFLRGSSPIRPGAGYCFCEDHQPIALDVFVPPG